ncbi:MAG: right-handed parallel beta-helix repeat-containing protein [Planctomycetota bacterium]
MHVLRTAAVLGGLLLASPAVAGTLYVNANLTTGLGDGSSWANAYQGSGGLKLAIAAAVSGDEIFVAQGTYLPGNPGQRTLSFQMRNGVTIYGGFLGNETSAYGRPAFGVAPTILSADLMGNDGSGLRTDNSYHVVTTAGTNSTAVLDGFYIMGGNANGTSNNDRGGGILCLSGVSPKIQNCWFEGNTCVFGGGAGYINGSSPSFTDCTFDSNQGGNYGGAFDIAGAGAVRFERCTFRGNSAVRAGAVEIFSTTGALVDNCLFVGNTATGSSSGGGLWLGSGGSTQIRGCTFADNIATATTVGAGLRNQGATVTVFNSIFWGNTAAGQTTAGAQISGATASYSLVQGGLTGTGNISANPGFANAAGGDFSLAPFSPAIDAGNNAQVPSGITLDLAHGRRFVDMPTTPDTGSGTAPIVDMGAFEYSMNPGTYYCPSSINSSGSPATITAVGSVSLAMNNLSLHGDSLPQGHFAFFLCGTQQGFVANPGGSVGNLCLGGSLGRFNGPGQILNAGTTGHISLSIDLTSLAQPSGPVAAMAGETWHFQCWYRDIILGFSTSNFTDAVSLTFE